MTLKAECIRKDKAITHSVVLIDSENLFRHARSKVPNLLRSLEQWTSQRMVPRIVFRSYGFPPAIARKWQPVEETMRRLGITHISTSRGDDVADNWLEADLEQVKDLSLGAVIGSGDNNSIRRCLDGITGASTRIEWVVMSPVESRPGNHPFAKEKLLGDFPADRVTTIARIYQEFVNGRGATRQPASSYRRERGSDQRLDISTIDWSQVRPGPELELGGQWRADTAQYLEQAADLMQAEARQLALTLVVRLPHSVPDHYHRELDQIAEEAWAWHCYSAILAAALVPGTPSLSPEVRVFRAIHGQRDEFSERVIERAEHVAKQTLEYDQRDVLRIMHRRS